MNFLNDVKVKGTLSRILSGVLAITLILCNTVWNIPGNASDIWPQKETKPFYCMDGGKAWRKSDRYREVSRQEAGVSEVQARRLFWAHEDVWEKSLKPAAAKYDLELYNQIKNIKSNANVVKRIKDDASTKFAWVADNPEIEERAKSAIVKYISEQLAPGKIPPAALFNSETGNYAINENDAIRIQVGDFGPGSALGQDFSIDSYFISQISRIEPQTVYDNGSTGGAVGWIDASQDKNIATSLFGTKLYEITWKGSDLHIVNNGSQYANETALDPNVPAEVKLNKTIVRFKITMKEKSGYTLSGSWDEDYLDHWMRFKICTDSPGRQRLYKARVNINPSDMPFYIEVFQDNTPGGEIPPDIHYDIPFQIYRHEETFRSDYNVRLKKMDAETGKPLKGSQFYLYERFDSGEELADSQKNAGLVEGGLDFQPWDGFQIFGECTTDENGEVKYTDTRCYTYEKTYCNGHPSPSWADIPVEETDESSGRLDNQGLIDAAKDANRSAARSWLNLVDNCAAEMDGVDTHFHWLPDEELYDDIKSASESGEPSSAVGQDAGKENAFEQSGCKEDCEKTYKNFIHMKFTYTWKEVQAARGYILHGLHSEDIPIEMITTDSSQAGAHSSFGGGYSRDITDDIWHNGGGKRSAERTDRVEIDKKMPLKGKSAKSKNNRKISKSIKEEIDMIQKYSSNVLIYSLMFTASNSNAARAVSSSNAGRVKSSSNAVYTRNHTKKNGAELSEASDDDWGENDSGQEFQSYLDSPETDGINHLDTGTGGQYSHCNGTDGCEDSWRVYDRRTEGRIHINKRDLDLYRKEKEDGYSSYGDTEGDATLEGAVYGLFAAEDILHPDSQIMKDGTVQNTGVVYRKNDLAAVTSTDENGDADFLAFTVAPGMTYQYERGKIERRAPEFTGPRNLYRAAGFHEEIDDYSHDGRYKRKYRNNEEINGDGWIGRPLILGKYYIKELARSEGFELSINGITQDYTNLGAGFDTPEAIASSHGTAVLSLPELSASMEGEDGGGNGYDQLPFSVTSSGTADMEVGTDGYDLVVTGFPEGTTFFRVDSGEEEITGPHVTGMENVIVRDEDGNPIWRRAESDSSNLRYSPVFNGNGEITGQTAMSREEEQVMRLEQVPLMSGMTIRQADMGNDSDLSERIPAHDITDDTDSSFLFIKEKMEEVLRVNGYFTPKRADGSYSTKTSPAYSRGIKKGDTDAFGQTANAGDPAQVTVYGEGVVRLTVKNVSATTTYADFISTLIAWYQDHPAWNFGGIDSIRKTGSNYEVTLYAGSLLAGKRRFFTAKNENGSLIADQVYVAYECPALMRYVYQTYDAAGEYTYEIEKRYSFGSGDHRRNYADVMIQPVLQGNPAGQMEKVYHTVMIFHRKGEEVVDYLEGDPLNGYRIPQTEIRDKIEITTEREQVEYDVPLTDVTYNKADGTYTIHVKSKGTDHYGCEFSDESGSLKLNFLAKTLQKNAVLTQEDIKFLGSANVYGYQAGAVIGYMEYLMRFTGAAIGVSLTTGNGSDDTYIVSKHLIYHGQDQVSEDGNTANTPAQVLERPVKQKIKVVKDIRVDRNGNYPNHTYSIHLDNFTSEFGGFKDAAASQGIANFRFKIYLKSNLERLFRKENGEIVWVDRNGSRTNIAAFRAEFPELVQKIFTEQKDGAVRILEEEPAPGHSYNYKKFFAAIRTANIDKWRRNGEILNSSFKPPAYSLPSRIENKINTSPAAKENACRSDAVRQFAVDWYLDDEVAAKTIAAPDGAGLVTPETSVYSDELYDRALYAAIIKAENYLKPFFLYDLDTIYSIEWDNEESGGIDGDSATLSADRLFTEEGAVRYSYGISKFLPYGDYVIVEQQPFNPKWMDFANRHYQIDSPKEISLPAAYEGGAVGAKPEPEVESSYYRYSPADRPEELARKYLIRFNEEWAENHLDDLRSYVIQARNHDGDFEIYPYGLNKNKSCGHYEPYGNKTVAGYYHYSSASENAGKEGTTATMTGIRTAFDGKFAPMLVPWSMTEPGNEASECTQNADGSSSGIGYAYRKLHNSFYSVRLRIEKLDSETGEPVLHDNAAFALYAGEREDAPGGDGKVKRYEKDTVIAGTRQFLEAMGAERITPGAREWDSMGTAGNTFYGIVSAGTPICREKECIILSDQSGIRTGPAGAFSTTWDEEMEREEGGGNENALQSTGYLETPKPVGAGVYVLAELKVPGGYARSKPVPVEVYSNGVSYYLNGEENRTAAVIFSYPLRLDDAAKEEGSGTARIYVNDAPVRLEVSKIKTEDSVRRMKVSGRVEGSIAELSGRYGLENIELAYNSSGRFLGYGWRRGTLEYLEGRKASKEAVELVYEGGVFQGYGYVTRKLETADDKNRCVPGAVLALYDAIEIRPSGDYEDFAFEGVEIRRDRNGSVKDMIVKEGYAGEEAVFLKKDDLWTVKRVNRGDTPVLFENLKGLRVVETDGNGNKTGFDREGKRQKITFDTKSVYALRDGAPVLEITGGDLSKFVYKQNPGIFTHLDRDTVIYHLDKNLCRDSQVDGYTGLLYIGRAGTNPVGQPEEHFFVWPVKAYRDNYGNVYSREKILTGRPAEMQADSENAFVTGMVRGEKFVKEMRPVFDIHGLVKYYLKGTAAYLKGRPVYDRDGDYSFYRYDDLLEIYNGAAYQIKDQEWTYDIGIPENPGDDKKIWRRQGEAYLIPNCWISGAREPNNPENREATYGRPDLLKRVYPGTYILEELSVPPGYVRSLPAAVKIGETNEIQSVSVTDEKTKVEILKVDGTENYRVKLENRSVPQEEGKMIQEGKSAYFHRPVVGARLALYRARRVATSDFERHPDGWYLVKSENHPAVWFSEGKEDNGPVKVTAEWLSDGKAKYFEGIPAGDYVLEEISAPPGYLRASMPVIVKPIGELQSFVLMNDHTKLEIMKYERDENGYQRPLASDNPAEFSLYPALLNAKGDPIYENGIPKYDLERRIDFWTADDLSEYLDVIDISGAGKRRGVLAKIFNFGQRISGFQYNYEKLFQQNGDQFQSFLWHVKRNGTIVERKAELAESRRTGKGETITQLWKLDLGEYVRITIISSGLGTSGQDGKLLPKFEYQFRYKNLSGEGVPQEAVSYDMEAGIHRIDRLSPGWYVAAETNAPYGYLPAEPKLIEVAETGNIWRYEMENKREKEEEKKVYILKTDETGKALSGAGFSIYRAASDGSLRREPAYLAETWISGMDGSYSESEANGGGIPEGFGAGDLKPHRLTRAEDGVYYLVETKPPTFHSGMEPVKIVLERNRPEVMIVKAVNRRLYGKVEIVKIDEKEPEKKLAGAKFSVTNTDQKNTVYMETDEEGKASSPLLPVGELQPDGTMKRYRYLIREEQAPDGYQIDETEYIFLFSPKDPVIEWTESGSEQSVILHTIRLSDRKTEISFIKTDFNGGHMIEGAKLAIYRTSVADGMFQEQGGALEEWTSEGRPHRVAGKLGPGAVYLMKEIAAPSGYLPTAPMVFSLDESGSGVWYVSENLKEEAYLQAVEERKKHQVKAPAAGYFQTEINMKDKEIRLTISKMDITSSKELPGARLSVRDLSGNLIEQWVSGDQPHIMDRKNLKAGETYILHEEAPPEGYAYAQDIKFQISIDGSIQKVVMKDRKTNVEIRKIDKESGELIGGAGLQIVDEDENIIEEWVSIKNKPHRLSGKLTAGHTYLVREVKAPDGYHIAKDVPFTVSLDGGCDRIVMEDLRIELKPLPPDTPPNPKPAPKPFPEPPQKKPTMGLIQASYVSSFEGKGRLSVKERGRWYPSIPRTGDAAHPVIILALLISGITGFLWAAWMRRRDGGGL